MIDRTVLHRDGTIVSQGSFNALLASLDHASEVSDQLLAQEMARKASEEAASSSLTAAEGVPTDGDKSERTIRVTRDLEASIEDVQTQTDCFCWYWYSYGEKSYGFAVVSAVAKYLEDETRAPVNGSELRINEDLEPVGIGTDGSDVTMVVMDQIAVIEAQDGRPICRFIAAAYAALVSVPPVRSDDTADQPQSEELNQ